jgi:hypothetical protein
MINEFWPELFKLNVICKLTPPLVIAKVGKKEFEFFNDATYIEWAKTAPSHSKDYFKGLGGYMTENFKKFLTDSKYTVIITAENQSDIDALNVAFDKTKQDERKEWLLQ